MIFEDFRKWMSGADCVVVGCGPSAASMGPDLANHWTIVCNRAVRVCHADFGLCIEQRKEIGVADKCWPCMRDETAPFAVFSHIFETPGRKKRPHPRVVQIGTENNKGQGDGIAGVKNFLTWMAPELPQDPPLTLKHSPFWAAAVAWWLGFQTIGMVGVDLDDDTRWTDGDRARIGAVWARLHDVMRARGSSLVNLSPGSRLDTLPRGVLHEVRPKC